MNEDGKDDAIVTTEIDRQFSATIDALAANIQARNAAKGFWDEGKTRNKLAMHMLMVTEIAETTEATRRVTPQMSAKIPDFTEEEEELADLVIRALDYAGGFELRLGDAILAKLKYNATRPHKHGKTC